MIKNSIISGPEMFTSLAYLTSDIPGTGGLIRCYQDDFQVEELPLYPFSGSGPHSIVQVEKAGISTMEAVSLLADKLKITRNRISYAGLKDAQAVTVQWLSFEDVRPDELGGIKIPGIKFREITRHENILKLGHLKGNKFIIKIRKLAKPLKESLVSARNICQVLADKGFPNYFGPQRFGNRYDSHLLGYALVVNDTEEFADLFLGRPNEYDIGKVAQARAMYDKGNYLQARKLWPYQFADQRKVLQTLARNGGKKKKIAFQVKIELKNLFVSAWQSYIFNQVLAARMPGISTILEGDMAYRYDNGAVFRVVDVAAEKLRCDAHEISPSGPLPGMRLSRLSGAAGEIENRILEANGITDEINKTMKKYYARTGRRALASYPEDLKCVGGSDRGGDFIRLEFILTPGCYATSLLREIIKNVDIHTVA